MEYDVIIIGGGPAGLTSAIYTSRARLKTLLIETYDPAGQAAITDWIENYPGFPEGINGFQLIENFKNQAKQFGTEIIMDKVTKLEKHENGWKITAGSKKYTCLGIIIATGAKPKELGIPGEKEYRGKGVSYCATCDGALFKDKDITVVGGGDTAIKEAFFLTKFAKKLYIVHRRDRLRATKIDQEKVLNNEKIEIVWSSTATAIQGNTKVDGVKVKNVKTNEEKIINCDGIFVFIGFIPNTEFLKGLIKLDKDGYIIANPFMETSKKGLYACGDCTQKLLRQVITACGDGATAAFSCQQYIEELKGIAYK